MVDKFASILDRSKKGINSFLTNSKAGFEIWIDSFEKQYKTAQLIRPLTLMFYPN